MSDGLQPGEVFAKDFQVERKLSQGGMGAVYVARQLSTDKLRALKLMLPQLAPDAKSRQRFIDEARIGGRIDSEHVVEVVAAGIDERTGAPWLAMELLEGEDLGALSSRRGSLPVGEVREVFLQAGHALGLAHAKGIVHRDLKPENLYLARARRQGQASVVKVLDFGIATALPTGGAGVVTTAVGSPFWMAPEQATPGAALTPATDVWALGLIAFQLLTGSSYWKTAKVGDVSIGAVLTEILMEPLVPASARAAALGLQPLPAGFDEWFARCVSRTATERFADAASCVEALDALLERVAPRAAVTFSSPLPEPVVPARSLDATFQRATPYPAAQPPAGGVAPPEPSLAQRDAVATRLSPATPSARAEAVGPPSPPPQAPPEAGTVREPSPPAPAQSEAGTVRQPSPPAPAQPEAVTVRQSSSPAPAQLEAVTVRQTSPAPPVKERGAALGLLVGAIGVAIAVAALWSRTEGVAVAPPVQVAAVTPSTGSPAPVVPAPVAPASAEPGQVAPGQVAPGQIAPAPGAPAPMTDLPSTSAPGEAPVQPTPPAPPPQDAPGPKRTARAARDFSVTRVKVSKGDGCTAGRGVTFEEAKANVEPLCDLIGQWAIVRLAGGGSMDGRGYQCKLRPFDERKTGESLCLE